MKNKDRPQKKFNIDKQALDGTGFSISDNELYSIISDSIFAHGKEIKMFKIKGENITGNTVTVAYKKGDLNATNKKEA